MTDVFNSDGDPVTPAPTEGDNKDYLEELVGEGKKFKDVKELAKGKAESDAYIETLTRKMDDLNNQLNKSLSAQEIADQLREELAKRTSSNQEPPAPGENVDDDLKNKTQPTISSEDVERLFEERELKKQRAANRAEVDKTLRDKIGATAPKFIEDKARELGMTLEDLAAQAEKSPKAFYRLVGVEERTNQVQTNAPPASSVNVTNSGSSEERNQSYYTKLYKENPHLRMDSKTTVQEHKDAQRLGERFFN